MGKLAMLVGVGALVPTLCDSVELASARQCSGRLCIGTRSADTLYERPGNGRTDAIYGKAGRDELRADRRTRNTDRLYCNRGKDLLTVNDGGARDTVSGGAGFDVCIADSSAEIGRGCERVRSNSVLPPPGPIVD